MPKIRLQRSVVPRKALSPKEQALVKALESVNEKETPPEAPAPKKKRSSKKKGPQKLDDHTPIDYPSLNHHELVAMAHRATLPRASFASTREMLIESLQELEGLPLQNPMDTTKTKLVKWIGRHWDKFQMQVPKDYEARLNSSDAQVAFFFLKNKDQMT